MTSEAKGPMSSRDLVPPLPFADKIFGFYSYKGGVGRTMALCHVAAWLSREGRRDPNSIRRILCIDLDIEAPGIPVYLPAQRKTTKGPPKARGAKLSGEGEQARGILGLLRDIAPHLAARASSKKSDDARKALGEALDAGTSRYIYQVAGADNLFVLPVGDVPETDRAIALDLLHRLLREAKTRYTPGATARTRKVESRDDVPFFSELRAAVREKFDYILIDSRTGLADEAFATTVLLADCMVFLFRPSAVQLQGIQRVLAALLYQRDMKATDPEVPVIPVLTPRPPYSDSRIKEVRDLAEAEIFKWLRADDSSGARSINTYSLKRPELIDLPYDSAVEIGESLLIPLDIDIPPGDPTAPLYRAYERLGEHVRRRNADNDVRGIQDMEREFHNDGRYRDAFKYLLARIAREPEVVSHWTDVAAGYERLLRNDKAMADDLSQFCLQVLDTKQAGPRARFFANLWLSEFYPAGQVVSERQIVDAWRFAQKETESPEILNFALARLQGFYSNHRNTDLHPLIPDYRRAAEGRIYAMLRAAKVALDRDAGSKLVYDVAAFLNSLSNCYVGLVDAVRHNIAINQDLLMLTPGREDRAALLERIAKGCREICKFDEAWAYYAAAADLSSPGSDEWGELVKFVTRAGTWSEGQQAIRKFMPPGGTQLGFTIVQAIRHGKSAMEIHKSFSKMKNYSAELSKEPTLKALALRNSGDISGARQQLENTEKSESPDTYYWARLALFRWLDLSTPIDPLLLKWARERYESYTDVSDPLESIETPVLLVVEPEGVANFAKDRLSRNLREWQRFQWSVLACVDPAAAPQCFKALRKTIDDQPLLARYYKRQDDFPMLRLIWQKHLAAGRIDPASHRSFITVLDMIDSVNCVSGTKLRKPVLEQAISSVKDPKFGEILERWLSHLQPIQKDEKIGDVITRLVQLSEKDAGASTRSAARLMD